MYFETKDLKRIKDIQSKSRGDYLNKISLASRMANSITDANKCHRRYCAAKHLGEIFVADIFLSRFKELRGI